MTGKPKGEIMTKAEMVEYGRQKRASSKIYKAESMQITDEAISKTVRKGLAEIIHADNVKKINLSDIDLVKETTKKYLEACAESASFPSVAGLCRAMGCSRPVFYSWMKRRDSETGQWFMMFHDLCVDILSEASLRNNVASIPAIFILKASYGLIEKENIILETNQYDDDYEDEKSSDYYKERYKSLIPE